MWGSFNARRPDRLLRTDRAYAIDTVRGRYLLRATAGLGVGWCDRTVIARSSIRCGERTLVSLVGKSGLHGPFTVKSVDVLTGAAEPCGLASMCSWWSAPVVVTCCPCGISEAFING
jgi:hypothetical protein